MDRIVETTKAFGCQYILLFPYILGMLSKSSECDATEAFNLEG
ncbi:MAG TPA: hypothetical protein VEB88_05405 [Candidatus Acidoferrales bacterium]|nr:hypothetical protein [Candidatus Acidoferrales bacterium]